MGSTDWRHDMYRAILKESYSDMYFDFYDFGDFMGFVGQALEAGTCKGEPVSLTVTAVSSETGLGEDENEQQD